MKIREIKEILCAELLCGEDALEKSVFSACCSDMMSDVLAYVKDQGVLITGLVNSQVIRTANMMDMVCVVFVRNKTITEDIVDLAKESGIVVMRSPLRAFEACGLLYTAGISRGSEGENV